MSTDNNETTGSEIPAPSPAEADPTSGAAPVPGPGAGPVPGPGAVPVPGPGAAPVPGPGGVPAAGVSFTPVSPGARKRMKVIGALVGVLVVLVIAGVVALKVVNSSRTPEAEVRKYLDLLASGQASAATAMVDPGVSNDQRSFLTDDVMASATSLLVVEDVVADKNDSSDTRMVTATMQVNGERFTHEFTVTKGSSTMGVLNNWTVKDSLAARVSVDVEGYAQFSVGGVNADASAAGRNDQEKGYLFYPGVYTFTPIAASEYADSNPETVSVLDDGLGGRDNVVTLKATYNTKLTAAAIEAGQWAVDTCSTMPGNQNSWCPFAIQSDAVTAVTGSMPKALAPVSEEQPTVFRATVVFTATYSNKYYMAGTQDVEAKVEIRAQLDDNQVLKLDKDGKPDFEVSFTR
ncbi:MAG: hypothetical protein U0I01_04300 [Pauljensenia sp.]|nr:hypothetical protein [Pauljensenia sp.]